VVQLPRFAFSRRALHTALMRKLIPIVAALVLFVGNSVSGDEPKEGGKALYHVVSLKLKEGATPEQIKAVEEAFAALKTKIPGITSLHWGTNVSPEHHDKGFTHCFVLTFAAEKDRDTYLTHDEHKAFGKVLGPIMADVMVIDFWAKD
jgi:hypothetical protein